MQCKVLFSLMFLFAGAWAQFNPTLTVDSCTQSSLVLTTSNAADGGIIYVQGQGAACKQTTTSGTNQHTIDFSSCGIQWQTEVSSMTEAKAPRVNKRQLPVQINTLSTSAHAVFNGADGGIIYVQGQGAACKQTTTSGTNQHSIDFSSCGIQWEESFKIVIQKKAEYQTGADKQIPIMCIADLADIDVTNSLNAADKDDDAGQNKTVKPTATMVLYKDGSDISGGTVKLTDTITMILKLDTEYLQDFDIKARDCTASTINIVSTYCSADTDLFPHVTRVQQGELSATFGAFRTTDLAGGAVAMPFSCTLQVCLGACPVTTCGDGSTSYGRKKRDITKRQADGSGIEDVSVGSSIAISTDQVVIESAEETNALCMNQGLFVALIIIMVGGLIASSVVTVIMYRKLQEKSTILKKLNPNHLTSMQIS